MFERRLKIILLILALVTFMLLGRAGQIQLVQKRRWTDEAADMMTLRQFVETTRGSVTDCRGRVVASDEPCIDACVDYRAITDEPDEKWLHERAVASAKARFGDVFAKSGRTRRAEMAANETKYLAAQLQLMWATLAKVSGKTPEEIEAVRRSVVRRVEMRRQYVWWQNYQKALAKQHAATRPATWYNRWWQSDDAEDSPRLDDYSVDVAEQSEAHVILKAVDTDVYNALAKNEHFPGLVLRPSRHRVYPFGQSACHVLGRVSAVGPEQIKEDPNEGDPLRKYWPNDLIGQGGVEGLCEQTLRGTRGELTRVSGSDEPTSTSDPAPGRDVRLTLDIELLSDVEQAFARRREFLDETGRVDEVRERQHGAAVVIDVPTGQVRALVSYPGFDPNTLDVDYPMLRVNDLDKPLLDRATQAAFEPGSTIKTVMACGALTDGLITTETTIECTGYLVLDGRREPSGRCWTARMFGRLVDEGVIATVAHHPFPFAAPHPTGFLTVVDALERSCNVFFETVADRMKMPRQRYWFDRFGLGRPTGVGLPEVSGRLPNPDHVPRSLLRMTTCFAGIGQGDVSATPIQMANVAATIARGGVWERPRLVRDEDVAPLTGRPAMLDRPDRLDLGLSAAALASVREGMVRVVNSRAGTGRLTHDGPPDALDAVLIAGKTGSAQAPKLTVLDRDAFGNVVMEDGRQKRSVVELGAPGTETWYVGVGRDKKDLAHAWMIGFAPADHPQVAFCVMVEYGGSGGRVAGGIARDVLATCVEHGYLKGN